MAGTVYALLVGIDAYPPPVPWLSGCRNDVGHLTTFLQGRLGERLRLVTLLDREATRGAIVEAIRTHLGQAAVGDVAVFSYSGHGSEEPVPKAYAALEPTGRLQTLVCVDVGRRNAEGVLVRPLADKELAVLLGEVAANGTHVLALLDCCHSGSGTRDAAARVRQWLPDPDRAPEEYRADVRELGTARPIAEFLAGTGDPRAVRPAPVALSACHSFELAKETMHDDGVRGVFSVAFLETLAASGPTTTYRSLLAGVRARVEREVGEQSPVLEPLDVNGPADSLVFDGTILRSDATFHVTRTATGFEVDAGSIHGLRSASGDEAFDLACLVPGTAAVAGLVRVTDAHASRSVVEPLGWQPLDIAYDAVVASVPLPAAVVRFDPGGPADACDRVREALSTAGPGGTPSPYVQVQDGASSDDDGQGSGAGSSGDRLVFRVAAVPDGYTVERIDGGRVTPTGVAGGPAFRILRPDGTPIVADQPGLGVSSARAVAARLEHIARWEQLKALGAHPSRLRDAVRLDIYPADPTGPSRPARAPLAAAAEYRLAYGRRGDAWQAPAMFLTLTNTTDRDLFVAVLDLTDRYRCHASLFPTARIDAGRTVAISDGRPVPASLPVDRAIQSGALARDWLKVIVSETDFDASAFEMSALDEPFVTRRSAASQGSALERLAGRVLTRGAGSVPPAGSPNPDWCAETYAVTITVP
jgi:hypothetical protein